MTISSDLIECLAEMPLGVRSADLLEQNPKLRDRAVILELADQVNRLAREDLSRAERLADVVTWLSELIADDFCRGRAVRCLGNIQVMRSNYQQAVRYFEDSLRIFEDLGVEAEVAAGLSSLIQPLMYMGEYARAFARAHRAREIALRRGDELLLARIDINFGNILHRQDRFSEAVKSYLEALGPLTELGQARDCAIVYLNLAVCYISLNDFTAAEEAYRQARTLSEKENMPAITAQADYNVAYLHYYRSEYGKAIELYQQTRLYCQRAGDSFHSALCDLDQAEMYLDLRLHEEATRLAAQAHTAFTQMNMPYEAAKAVVWLAIAAYQDRRLFRVLEFLGEARKQMKSEGNTAWTAVLDLYQALVLQQEGRYYEALRHCKSAQMVLTDGSFKCVHADLIRAGLELDIGRQSEARQLLEGSLIAAEKLRSPHLLFHAYKALGRCQEEQNLPGEALMSYQQSLVHLEQIPVQAIADGFKIPYLKNKLEIYEALLSLGLTGSPATTPEAVLDLVEKRRSREIADLVSFRANALKTPSRSRSALVEQLRNLREELSWYYRRTQTEELTDRTEGALQATEMRGLIRNREKSLLETLEAMRETEAEFHSIQAAGVISLDKVQQCLKDDELLLEFFEARGLVYVGLVTCATSEIIPLTRTLLIRDYLRRLNSRSAQMESDEGEWPTEGELDKTLSILKTIHEVLIQPIQVHLGHRRLIIAPEGPLRYIPFHALFDGKDFLTGRHILSYVGSASLYYLAWSKTAVGRGRKVAIGVEVGHTPHPTFIEGFSRAADLEQLRQGGETRFVHLDCQLLPRVDNPMMSTLVIGGSEKTVLDLFNLQVPCSVMGVTGVGPGVRADGDGKELEGLARSLEYSGARTLLLPLWNGRKAATELFLKNFYKQADINADTPFAFQVALAAVRKKYPNPLDWAPFIVRGQTGRSEVSK